MKSTTLNSHPKSKRHIYSTVLSFTLFLICVTAANHHIRPDSIFYDKVLFKSGKKTKIDCGNHINVGGTGSHIDHSIALSRDEKSQWMLSGIDKSLTRKANTSSRLGTLCNWFLLHLLGIFCPHLFDWKFWSLIGGRDYLQMSLTDERMLWG